ncbi:MAG: Uncharacterized protein G01um101413_938 [Parcubacteria group bacterium Gr01-1014_13]|nr:MAG: Uncharacterized protein G01um101413_938 [Parcubacteria group bacterium Gr01-1014_13]
MKIVKLNKSGQIILFAMVFMTILLMLSGVLISLSGLHSSAERHTVAGAGALTIAEAGLDKAIYQLNLDPNFSGESSVALGDGNFSTVISTLDPNRKQIVSTGKVTYQNGVVAERIVSVIASIDLTVVNFQFGVQAGYGGFSMENNSRINGNVFANANISGSGVITGDASVAAGSAAAPDQSWQVNNADFLFGNTSARDDAAQSFIPSANNIITKVKVYLKKIGNPGNLTVRIVTDNNGQPSKTVLASGSISASTITGSYAFIEGAFSDNPTLFGGQKYWLMLSSPINSSNYYSWGLDNTDGFASNTGKYSTNWNASTPVWNAAGGDFNFQTIMGGTLTSLAGVTVNGTVRAPAITGCTIGANAYYQTTNTCSVAGTIYPSSTPPAPQVMPISQAQITDWEQAAVAGGTIGGLTLDSQSATLGPVKINGNLTIQNNSTVWLAGPVWVVGNILLANNSVIRGSVGLGNSGTVLIADDTVSSTVKGKITISNNTSVEGNGNPNSYIMVISNYAGTGTAIKLENNASGTIFYAPNGTINVENNATPIQLTANLIHLENNAVINYQTGLQSANFSSGPGGSWAFQAGSYAIVK